MSQENNFATSQRMQQVAQRNGKPNAQQSSAQQTGNKPAPASSPSKGGCSCNH